MFDPVRVTHDELVARAIGAKSRVSWNAVVEAFLSSLSSRRLELRSALGSLAYLQHMPNHSFTETSATCPVCGWHEVPEFEHDLSVLNFERHKWGGVRHHDLLYTTFDLELFAKTPPVEATNSDHELLLVLLDSIESVPSGTTSSALEKHLKRVLKSNKAERQILLGILGMVGVLGTADHPGYGLAFVRADEVEIPPRRFVDMHYPACWWTRDDGLNRTALDLLMPGRGSA
ncbi:MAG: hypothetical protein AAFX94_01165 [Myxococcota bacterium]